MARRDLDAEPAQCEQPVLCCGALELLIRIHWHTRVSCTCTHTSEVGKRQHNREFRVCVRVVLDVSCVLFSPSLPLPPPPPPLTSPHTHTQPPNNPTATPRHTTPRHTTPHSMARSHEFHLAVPQDETMKEHFSEASGDAGVLMRREQRAACFSSSFVSFSHSHDLFLLTVIEAGRSPDACDSGKQDSKIQGENQVASVQPRPIGAAHVPAGHCSVSWSCAFFSRLSKILRSLLAHFGKWTHRDPG